MLFFGVLCPRVTKAGALPARGQKSEDRVRRKARKRRFSFIKFLFFIDTLRPIGTNNIFAVISPYDSKDII